MEKERKNYDYYYGVYCLIDMANDIIDKSKGYDITWDKGIELYDIFLLSKYDNPNKSELDCINDFLNNQGRQHYYLSTQLDKERLFNFLKDDLGKLEQDIKENNKEKIEQFFSYWKQHINDLNK